MKKILHIAPHYGGGVGRAISNLVGSHLAKTKSQFDHVLIALEIPEKDAIIQELKKREIKVLVAPNEAEIAREIDSAEIVQIEWWAHPSLFQALTRIEKATANIILWCHQSNLVNPILPKRLIESVNQVIFTAPCTSRSPRYKSEIENHPEKFSIISSAAGVEDMPPRTYLTDRKEKLNFGYLGTLSFSKLTPDFIDLISVLDEDDLPVRLIGDPNNRNELTAQSEAIGRPNLVEFAGYRQNIAAELQSLDIFLYLLNRRHYGTAENALVEAMAMGVVPIVLNNEAEKDIVEHGVTGFIVENKSELRQIVKKLKNDPTLLKKISRNASHEIRNTYTIGKLQAEFEKIYEKINQKKTVDFLEIFGVEPSGWFLQCQADHRYFSADENCLEILSENIPHDLIDNTKGSVNHFFRYFPEDRLLNKWASNLSGAKNTAR